MENQSTNNITDTPIKNKVVCRKCGGSHFTIKCGKDKQLEQNTKIVEHIPYETKKSKYEESNRTFERKHYFKTTYRVKVSELPIDMTEEEMMQLTCDWGHIVRIRILNYRESSVAYIDFGYEEEAEYFIKAIDKTPFELLVISAQKVESQRQ